MADTIREIILAAIKSNLENIQIANGYNSECGDLVIRGEMIGDIDRIPAVTMFAGIESGERNSYGNDSLRLPVELAAYDFFTQSDDWETQQDNIAKKAEQLLGDLRKSMGQSIAGANVEDVVYREGGVENPADIFDGEIAVKVNATFEVVYNTELNDPYNQ